MDDWPWGSVWDWTTGDVAEYIASLGLQQYCQCFEGNNVNGKRLMRVLSEAITEAQNRTNGLIAPTKLAFRAPYTEDKPLVPPEHGSRSASPASDFASSTHSDEVRLNVRVDADAQQLEFDDDLERAALKIQNAGRGMLGRKRAKQVRAGEIEPMAKEKRNTVGENTLNERTNQQSSPEVADDSGDVRVEVTADDLAAQEAAALKIQNRARGMAGRKRFEDVKAGRIEPEPKPPRKQKVPDEASAPADDAAAQEAAALKIQNRARGMAGRKRFEDVKAGRIEPEPKPPRKQKVPNEAAGDDAAAQEAAALKIQNRARGMAGRKRFEDVKAGRIEPEPKPPRKQKAAESVTEGAPTEAAAENAGAENAIPTEAEAPAAPDAAPATEAPAEPDAAPAAEAAAPDAAPAAEAAAPEQAPEPEGAPTEG